MLVVDHRSDHLGHEERLELRTCSPETVLSVEMLLEDSSLTVLMVVVDHNWHFWDPTADRTAHPQVQDGIHLFREVTPPCSCREAGNHYEGVSEVALYRYRLFYHRTLDDLEVATEDESLPG